MSNPSRLSVLALCAINYAEAIQGNLLWSYLPFAAERWGASPDALGVSVGLIASSYFAAQALTNYSWGRAADHFGRRPVMLWGVLVAGLAMLAFGFVDSVWAACAVRFLGGALSGNTATSKVYIGESGRPEDLPRLFSYLALTWGLGVISAPAIGGFLAAPVEAHPALFVDGAALAFARPFLARWPYVLPSLVGGLWAVLTFMLGWTCLPETPVFLARQERLRARKLALAAEASAAAAAHDEESAATGAHASKALADAISPPASATAAAGVALVAPPAAAAAAAAERTPRRAQQEQQAQAQASSLARFALRSSRKHMSTLEASALVADAGSRQSSPRDGRSDSGGGGGGSPDAAISGDDLIVIDADDADDDGVDTDARPVLAVLANDADDERAPLSGGLHLRAPAPDAAAASAPAAHLVADTPGRPRSAALAPAPAAGAAAAGSGDGDEADLSICALLSDAPIRSCLMSYGMLCAVQVVFDELLPVLAKLSIEQGGLGYSAEQSGSIQIVSGAAHVTTQLLLFPYVCKKFGPRASFRASLLPLMCLVLFPLVHYAAVRAEEGPWPLLLALSAALIIKTVAMAISFSTILLLVNNVARGQHLGQVTGASQAVASAVRAIGPTLGGLLFSSSIALSYTALGISSLLLTYVVLSIAALATYLIAAAIPAWVDGPQSRAAQLLRAPPPAPADAAGGEADEEASPTGEDGEGDGVALVTMPRPPQQMPPPGLREPARTSALPRS